MIRWLITFSLCVVEQNNLNLIVGGESVIGGFLSEYWSERNIPFHYSTRHKKLESERRPFIDLLEMKNFNNFFNYKSAVICAAITDMATCENDPLYTRTVNVFSTLELIKKLLINKTHIVFLSTNQVFDGKKPKQKPDASRNPINEYGKQKADVEVFLENISSACILRLTKVIHPNLELLNKWKIHLSNSKSISAFMDMTLSPVNIIDVIKKIDLLVSQKQTGIYQLSGENDINYFEYARNFAEENGFSPDLVKKDSWKGKLEFEPPKFTSMVNV